MILDDGDLKRLARIARQLDDEDPELVRALREWRPPGGPPRPWRARAALGTGIVLAVLAVLLGSGGWFLFGVLLCAGGWGRLRMIRGEPPFESSTARHPTLRKHPW